MYYGFDIGGSKIALGVFNQERRLQWEKRVATPKSSYEDFLGRWRRWSARPMRASTGRGRLGSVSRDAGNGGRHAVCR